MSRQALGVDFDGVLHSYESGWQGDGSCPDPPVDGAIDWLNEITDDYDVAINSVRNETASGRTAMYNWLLANGVGPDAMDAISIEPGKPRASLYVDDRGWRFDGSNFPTAADVEASAPWWEDDGEQA